MVFKTDCDIREKKPDWKYNVPFMHMDAKHKKNARERIEQRDSKVWASNRDDVEATIKLTRNRLDSVYIKSFFHHIMSTLYYMHSCVCTRETLLYVGLSSLATEIHFSLMYTTKQNKTTVARVFASLKGIKLSTLFNPIIVYTASFCLFSALKFTPCRWIFFVFSFFCFVVVVLLLFFGSFSVLIWVHHADGIFFIFLSVRLGVCVFAYKETPNSIVLHYNILTTTRKRVFLTNLP